MSKFIPPLSRDERAKYDESLKILRDRLSEIAYAEKRGEHNKQIEIARSMKNDGMPIEMIIRYTGLSVEMIDKL